MDYRRWPDESTLERFFSMPALMRASISASVSAPASAPVSASIPVSRSAPEHRAASYLASLTLACLLAPALVNGLRPVAVCWAAWQPHAAIPPPPLTCAIRNALCICGLTRSNRDDNQTNGAVRLKSHRPDTEDRPPAVDRKDTGVLRPRRAAAGCGERPIEE